MRKRLLVSVMGLCVFVTHGQTAEVTTTVVPGMVSDGNEWTIYAGHEGPLVALVTVQSLAPEDSDTALDGYLLDLDSGDIALLAPAPASGSVTLDSGHSFFPRSFSADGTRLLMAGNSNQARAASGHAAVVFDFSTSEYIPASVLPGDAQAERPGNELMSGDGKYVIFSDAHYLDDSWEMTWYRRDLDAGSTETAVVTADGGTAIKEDEGRFYAVSSDGARLLGYATDGVLDAGDVNGVTDYFLFDMETKTATRIDAVTKEGLTLDPQDVLPSPDFAYLLLRLAEPEVPSRVGTWTVHDKWAVYNVATGETVGLTEFLNLPARFAQIWDDTSVGSEAVFWGESSRYLVVSQAVWHLPGDADFDPKYYVIDRENNTGWIAGMDNAGAVHSSYTHFARSNGGVLQYMAGSSGGNVFVLEHTPLVRDLALSATAGDGAVTITLRNDGDADIHNAGVSISYSLNEIDDVGGTDAFEACGLVEINLEKRAECRVSLIEAGSTREFTLTVANDATLDIVAGVLSDRDATPDNNTVSVEISKTDDSGGNDDEDDDDSGSGGGGPFTPWLLAMLMCVRSLQWRRSR